MSSEVGLERGFIAQTPSGLTLKSNLLLEAEEQRAPSVQGFKMVKLSFLDGVIAVMW
jgi:hypothetical protein